MFRHGVRRIATTAARRAAAAAKDPSAHTLAVSKAQGIAKGLTGGTRFLIAFVSGRIAWLLTIRNSKKREDQSQADMNVL